MGTNPGEGTEDKKAQPNRNCSQRKTAVLPLSHVRLLATPGTVACWAPLSTGFSRQEHWSGLPCPPPGHLLDPRAEPRSPALVGGFFTISRRGRPPKIATGSSKSTLPTRMAPLSSQLRSLPGLPVSLEPDTGALGSHPLLPVLITAEPGRR